MKNIQNLFSALVCGLVLTFATSVSAQDAKQGIATVVRIKGSASYTLESGPDAKWIPLVPGKVLQAGATIKTEPEAIVDVVLGKGVNGLLSSSTPDRISYAPDSLVRGLVSYKPLAEQNVIRLLSDTTLKIDKLTIADTGVDTVSDTELDLQKGRIFASVKKLSPASQYLIKIPNGIAGVRGTVFGIGADGWLAVVKNSVILSLVGPNGQPVTVTVGEGNQFSPGTGQTTPLPLEIITLLREIAIISQTPIEQVGSFSSDKTFLFVSPNSGLNL